jgi:hypothetical protein
MTAAVSVASNKFIEQQLATRKVESLDLLPKDVRKQIKQDAKRIALNDVFGVDHKTDKAGNPIEQGVGSKSNQTAQSIEAYIKNQTERSPNGPEPGYEETLAQMRKDFAACEAHRIATRTATDDDED